MSKGRIIVIDDEVNILKMIELSLCSEGYDVSVFSDASAGLKRAQEVFFDAAFIDLKMHPVDGLQVLSSLKSISPDTTVILMTAYATIETAVEAIKKGAYDYIAKPFTHQEFIHIVARVFEHHKLHRKILGLKTQLEDFYKPGDIITNDFAMRNILKTSFDAAKSEIPILIEGESGTGKELLARYIHESSNRCADPFIAINCAAIPESLFESELFGHAKGAFTGAIKDRVGRVELANNGTIFLDELSEIPKFIQVKLLRFLQNMEFERVGESITRKVDVRIISATNHNINEDLKTGALRDDFYYRISAVRIKLPALKDRKEDIELLVKYFLGKYAPGSEFIIEDETLELLLNYDWPGNIRELENVVKRLIVFSKEKIIKSEYLPVEIFNEKSRQFLNIIPKLEELEKQHITQVLTLTISTKEAARILGISETTLWRKRKQFGI